MNTLENAFLDALAADLRIAPEPTQQAVNPRTGKPYPTGVSLEPAMGAVAETVGAAAKGAAQGFVGLPGDLIALARGVYELGRSGGDLDAFVAGLKSKTGLPTTEDIKKFLDEAGLKAGTGESPAETVGEFAAPGGYVKGAKKVAGKVKEVLQTPPRGSIKLAPDLEVDIAPAERTKNFKNWFGNSRIIDDEGKPLVMYHGTTKNFSKFKASQTPDDHVPGISVTDDISLASSYSEKGDGANVMPIYVVAKKPIKYPELEDWALAKAYEKGFDIPDESDFAAFDIPPKTLLKWLKEDGYDAIDYRDDPMLGYGLRVFDPKQIKSAIGNRGTFDPKDPNILRGAVAAPVGAAATQDEESK